MAVYMHTQDCLNFLVNFSVHYSIKMNLSFKNVLFTSISIPASFLFVFTCNITCYFFCSVQSLSPVRLFATPWTTAHQASLSITNSWSLPRLRSIESVMPSNISSSVVPCSSCPQSFPASGSFPMSQFFASDGQSIRVSASTSVLPMNTQDWSPLGWTGWSPCSPRDSQESSPTPQCKSINSLGLSFLYSPPLTPIHDYWKNRSLD